MKKLIVLVAAGYVACIPLADACSSSPQQTAFDTVAPTATDIVAVQVESLALERNAFVAEGLGHSFRGGIRVLKHYRGSGHFEAIRYINGHCSGLRLQVGGIYLIATRSSASTIELDTHAAPILHLPGYLAFDPDLVLRNSDTVKQLEAALRGERSFAITTTAARQEMSMHTPPPPVPPPADFPDGN